MSIAFIFEQEIERCLPTITDDTWALHEVRSDLVEQATPREAFTSVIDVLELALRQNNYYAFCSCCWLALQLAGRANSNNYPNEIKDYLEQIHTHSAQFGWRGKDEANKVKNWFLMLSS